MRAEWPFHLPQLINPFKHFLWILKTTHAGADLDTALVMAKGSLGACITEPSYLLVGTDGESYGSHGAVDDYCN